MYKIILGMLLLATAEVAIYAAHAQTGNGPRVVTTCGTLPQPYAVGSTRQLTVDINGLMCQ